MEQLELINQISFNASTVGVVAYSGCFRHQCRTYKHQ